VAANVLRYSPHVLLRCVMVALLVLGGCSGVSDEPPAHASAQADPGEHTRDPEYKEGLSVTLEMAPSEYAADRLSEFYDFGYLVGRAEGLADNERWKDWARSSGCTGALPFFALRSREVARPLSLETCDSLFVRPEFKDARFSGPQFYENRIVVQKKAARTGDRVIMTMMQTAYENGYAMGFKRSNKEQSRFELIRTYSAEGCRSTVAFAARQNALSRTTVDMLHAECDRQAIKDQQLYTEIRMQQARRR
jgi:hypothetical protein